MTFRLVRTALVLTLIGAAQAVTATAKVPSMAGQTGADAVLQKDILRTIVQVAKAMKCSAIRSIYVDPISTSEVTRRHSFYSEVPGTAYEDWKANLCGNDVHFLIKFAPAPQGGSVFSVTYPFPVDARSERRP